MDHRPGPDLQADEVTALAGEGDPSTAPFTSFTRMAAQAAGKKTAIDLQARTGPGCLPPAKRLRTTDNFAEFLPAPLVRTSFLLVSQG
jgi:hypothetical protein